MVLGLLTYTSNFGLPWGFLLQILNWAHLAYFLSSDNIGLAWAIHVRAVEYI